MSNLDRFTVKATAKSVRRKSILLKAGIVVLTTCVSLLLLFYGFANFAETLGNFTIKVGNTDDQTGITLSNDPTFSSPTVLISADAVEKMDNITESWLPTDLDSIDGGHNGENYIAHTFYIKNIGNVDINYLAEIKILEVEKEADEAMRVKVYRNGESTLYAKKQKGSDIPELNTTPFYSIDKVMSQEVLDFKVNDVDKYTIVVWLEGWDNECIDNILGGQVRMEMNFKITKSYE